MHGYRLTAKHAGARQLRALASAVDQIVNPTIAMLAPFFLLLTGAALIAGGFGFLFPEGYIYAAMAFPCAIEGLDMLATRRRKQPPK